MKRIYKSSVGAIEIYVLLLLLIGAVALVGGFTQQGEKADYLSLNPGIQANLQPNTSSLHKSLQLENPVAIITPTPTSLPPVNALPTPTYIPYIYPPSPTPSPPSAPNCPVDIPYQTGSGCNCIGDLIQCQNGIANFPADTSYAESTWNAICAGIGNGSYCYDKPVIYLYPQVDTLVNVKLSVPGFLTISIPHIASSSPTGWNNVLAHPDGSLQYQGKTYHELYYESEVHTVLPSSSTGILIPTRNLQQTLRSITGKLGLLPSEQQEFLDYWVPKLDSLNSSYIFISLLSQQQKDMVDRVTITPIPDTLLAYLFTFKPVALPFAFEPLKLPQTPPQRTGFTAVEWGGTIENNTSSLLNYLQ